MGEGNVWVLLIVMSGERLHEVHKTLDGCIDSVISDLVNDQKQGKTTPYDYDAIRAKLEEDLWWQDDADREYYIDECPLQEH